MIISTLGSRSPRRNFRGLLLAVFCLSSIFIVALRLGAAEATKKSFDLPAGDAATTLKAFTQQSGEQIVYPVEQMRGVKTNAVTGELSARAALDLMLKDTGLVAVQDEKTGALAVRRDPNPNASRVAQTEQRPPGKKQD